MTLLVRDEADIIGSNLAFHADRGVDHFIVMDNRSRDCTRDLIAPFERGGMATYIYQAQDDYAQHAWVTDMARRAYTEFGADWVINNDADEFWWPQGGDLKSALASVDPSALAVQVERVNFLPRRDASGLAFADVMTLRETRSLNALGQPLPGKVCHRGVGDVVVEQGNHGVSCYGCAVAPVLGPISILHFPVRSYAQLANKIAKGGAAYKRNAYLAQDVGATWRRMYEMLQRDQLKDYFDSLCLDDARLKDDLEAGRIVRDLRLRDALASLARSVD